VAVRGIYEVVVHNVRAALNVHPDYMVLQVDVVNVFNSISHKAIFQKLRVARSQLSLFLFLSTFFNAVVF
jgi:hypothetical protein